MVYLCIELKGANLMSNQLADIVARDIIFILDTKGNVASVLLTPEKYEYLLDRVDEIVVEYNE